MTLIRVSAGKLIVYRSQIWMNETTGNHQSQLGQKPVEGLARLTAWECADGSKERPYDHRAAIYVATKGKRK